MRRFSQLDQHETFLLAAVLTGHASFHSQGGFRQKDIKFFVDMFSNWMNSILEGRVLQAHNTQIMRYLDALVKTKEATKNARSGQPRYLLTRLGLENLAKALVQRTPRFPIEQIYFVIHMVQTYRGPILKVIFSEDGGFSPKEREDFKALFRVQGLIEDHIQFLNSELAIIRQRIRDCESVVALVRSGRKEGLASSEIIKKIESDYPYDLNSQKSLSTLYSEMPDFVRDWVLDVALPPRAPEMWVPLEKTLQCHLDRLQDLKASLAQ